MNSLPPALPRSMAKEDIAALDIARGLLEQPSLGIRLANMVGAPIERGMAALPKNWARRLHSVTEGALKNCLSVALKSLQQGRSGRSSNRRHLLMVALSGGAGGIFGLPALLVELPVSTTLMLRSIADIARAEGHSLRDPTVRLDCLSVFALGGTSTQDDAAEKGYWATRAALAMAVREATAYLSGRQAVELASPALAHLVAAIASRFGVAVSEQAAAKAVPILGMASGAAINVIFMTHFQNMARGHFILRRLEERYGQDLIHKEYQRPQTRSDGRPAR